MAAKQGVMSLSSAEKDVIHRLILCLSARYQCLLNLTDSITSADMKKLVPVMELLFTGKPLPDIMAFPVDAPKYNQAAPVRPSTEGAIIAGDKFEQYAEFQQSHAAVTQVTGTVVALKVERIGLKDAQVYIDPRMSVLVTNQAGVIIDSHEIQPTERRVMHVVFNQTIYLGLSLEELTRNGASIFFEFKHYKPKKKKVSTRCWAFMELNELKQDEEIILEIYHKPTDLKKKKLKLHSEKPLYIHLVANYMSR